MRAYGLLVKIVDNIGAISFIGQKQVYTRYQVVSYDNARVLLIVQRESLPIRVLDRLFDYFRYSAIAALPKAQLEDNTPLG